MSRSPQSTARWPLGRSCASRSAGWLPGSPPGLERFERVPPVRDLRVQAWVPALFEVRALQNLGVELLPPIAGLGVAERSAPGNRLAPAQNWLRT